MIKKFSVENFLSIKDKITLNLESSKDKSLNSNVFQKENLLKSSVIYGHNASGKTNLLKALGFLLNTVLFSHQNSAGDKINRIPYKLDKKYLKKETKFELDFILNKKEYSYKISFDENKVYNESLKENKKIIFNRKETNKYSFGDKLKLSSFKNSTLDNMSFISRAVNLKEEGILKEIYLWIKNNILIVISDGPFEEFDKNDTAEFIYNNSKYKEKIMELLESCDLGIVDLEVKKKSEEDIPIDLPKKFHKYLMTEFDIKFIHEQENGNKIERISFDYNEESSGTQKIFDIAGSILDSLENNKVLFIDELEKSLHPLLMEHIVKIFNGKKNKNSQLIFTTHNTELLDLNILRRDQIWFMEKDPNKDTSLISIFDFKGIRKDLDIKKAYYSGRFGAIPITTDNYN